MCLLTNVLHLIPRLLCLQYVQTIKNNDLSTQLTASSISPLPLLIIDEQINRWNEMKSDVILDWVISPNLYAVITSTYCATFCSNKASFAEMFPSTELLLSFASDINQTMWMMDGQKLRPDTNGGGSLIQSVYCGKSVLPVVLHWWKILPPIKLNLTIQNCSDWKEEMCDQRYQETHW